MGSDNTFLLYEYLFSYFTIIRKVTGREIPKTDQSQGSYEDDVSIVFYNKKITLFVVRDKIKK